MSAGARMASEPSRSPDPAWPSASFQPRKPARAARDRPARPPALRARSRQDIDVGRSDRTGEHGGLSPPGPGGHPVTGFDIRSRFAGHARRSAPTRHALGLEPDHPIGGRPSAGAPFADDDRERLLPDSLRCPAGAQLHRFEQPRRSVWRHAAPRAAGNQAGPVPPARDTCRMLAIPVSPAKLGIYRPLMEMGRPRCA